MTVRLRTGVIGGGLIAQAIHLPSLSRLADCFHLTAIVDASPSIAAALAARYGASGHYTDWRVMLDSEVLDAVIVCSPPATTCQESLPKRSAAESTRSSKSRDASTRPMRRPSLRSLSAPGSPCKLDT